MKSHKNSVPMHCGNWNLPSLQILTAKQKPLTIFCIWKKSWTWLNNYTIYYWFENSMLLAGKLPKLWGTVRMTVDNNWKPSHLFISHKLHWHTVSSTYHLVNGFVSNIHCTIKQFWKTICSFIKILETMSDIKLTCATYVLVIYLYTYWPSA